MELWSQRSRFQMILEEREAWLAAAANDLGLRAAGMESAEAVAQTLGRVFDSDNAFYRCMLRGDGYELVREALERIQDLLRTDGRRYFFFSRGDTSVSEQEIRESIEIVLDLAPAVLRAVLAGMAGMLIEKWLAKLDDHDIEPELLRDLFDHVARGATGTQLGTMALLSDETSHRYLIDAIGSETSDERQYWAFRTVVGAIGDSEGNLQLAVDLLGAMNAETRETALRRLDGRGQLTAFVNSLLLVEERYDVGWGASTGVFRTLYDASPLISLVQIIVMIDSRDLKASVFVAAVRALEGPLAKVSEPVEMAFVTPSIHRFEGETGDQTLVALVDLILSDAGGVFDALRLDADIYGATTGDFLRELLRAPGTRDSIYGEPLWPDGAIMTNQILAAVLGEGLDPGRRAAFFQTTEVTAGGLDDYVNAARLGYFAGTLSSGLDELGMSDGDEWTAVGIVLGGVALVDPTKVTSVAKFVNSTLIEISSNIQDRNIEQLQQEYAALEQMMVDEILPRDGPYIYDGDAADEFFNTYNRVGRIVAGQ